VLGLGIGNKVMNSRFGIAPFESFKMIEEYVSVVRSVLRGGHSGFAGQVPRTGMVGYETVIERIAGGQPGWAASREHRH